MIIMIMYFQICFFKHLFIILNVVNYYNNLIWEIIMDPQHFYWIFQEIHLITQLKNNSFFYFFLKMFFIQLYY